MSTMPSAGSTSLTFPDFRGATRWLVLINVFAYFALLLIGLALPSLASLLSAAFGFDPHAFLNGALWQPFTYSFIHEGIVSTVLALVPLWFLAGFLEQMHRPNWVIGLYAAAVLGTAAAALVLYIICRPLGLPLGGAPLYGCFGGTFGLLTAIGVLYGDTQVFLIPFPMQMKARYLVVLFALISLATLFGDQKMYAFAELGGALAGLFYIRLAPRRGVQFGLSERWFALRNAYYRWKRRRAARKFEVYMRSQGRTVHLDGRGKRIDDDPSDKKRWN